MHLTALHRSWNTAKPAIAKMLTRRFGVPVNGVYIYPLHSAYSDKVSDRTSVTYSVERGSLGLDSSLVGEESSYGSDSPDRTIVAPLGSSDTLQYQLQHPRLFGATFSTLAQYRYCTWRTHIKEDDPDLDLDHLAFADELSRICGEYREVTTNPMSAELMMAAGEAIIPSVESGTKVEPRTVPLPIYVHRIMLYIWGRYRSGVFHGEFFDHLPERMRDTVETVLPQGAVETFTSLLDEAFAANHANPAVMLHLGKRWFETLEHYCDGVNYDTEADPADLHWLFIHAENWAKWTSDENIAMLRLRFPALAPPPPPMLPPSTLEEWARETSPDDGNDDDQGRKEPTDEDASEDDDSNYETGGQGIPRHRLLHYREPKPKEIADARHLTETFRRLHYRQPRPTLTPSALPGGRLNTRQLVQATAQRAAGQPVTATPWQRQHFETTIQPGLNCAFVVDSSGSMGIYKNEIASLAWVMAQAAGTIGSRISAWGFGGGSFELVRAGTQPRQVATISAPAGTGSDGTAHALAEAAVDAELATATGAKIAIIVSDAALSDHEYARLQRVIDALRTQEVTCLFVHVGDNRKDVPLTGVTVRRSPWGAELAPEISQFVCSTFAEA